MEKERLNKKTAVLGDQLYVHNQAHCSLNITTAGVISMAYDRKEGKRKFS